jgi:3',5'-cyclic AMP phosphodiesterase CpdA
VCAAGVAGCVPKGPTAEVARPDGQGGSREQDWEADGHNREADAFSFVHLTDMHVTPKRKGDEGYRKCIETVRALRCKPAFALMGGDLGFDGGYHTKDEFETYIRLYKEISDGLGVPYYNCMGNHDALGWTGRRKVAVDDPEIGKKMIMNRLNWEKSYYSFDHGGWHFVVLDSIYPIKSKDGPTYEPRIGKEQLEWLAYDLGTAGGRPTVAVTHIAAFCNRGQLKGLADYNAMDGHMVMWDTLELRRILERHKVKALLQGHSHTIEEFRFNGVWYLTSAAASGSWWAGDWVGSPPGYTVFHCRGDELTWEHVSYEWEPQLEPEDERERKEIAAKKAFDEEQKRLFERERAGIRG